jgi:excisionase family DNA binding protein
VEIRNTPDTLKAMICDGDEDRNTSENRLLALLNGKTNAEQSIRNEVLPEPELLTKKQAAALMALSIRTMDRLVAKGDIPHVSLGKRCVRFPLKPLRAWIEAKIK